MQRLNGFLLFGSGDNNTGDAQSTYDKEALRTRQLRQHRFFEQIQYNVLKLKYNSIANKLAIIYGSYFFFLLAICMLHIRTIL